jgi:hypothetical protein
MVGDNPASVLINPNRWIDPRRPAPIKALITQPATAIPRHRRHRPRNNAATFSRYVVSRHRLA